VDRIYFRKNHYPVEGFDKLRDSVLRAEAAALIARFPHEAKEASAKGVKVATLLNDKQVAENHPGLAVEAAERGAKVATLFNEKQAEINHPGEKRKQEERQKKAEEQAARPEIEKAREACVSEVCALVAAEYEQQSQERPGFKPLPENSTFPFGTINMWFEVEAEKAQNIVDKLAQNISRINMAQSDNSSKKQKNCGDGNGK
jgi:hypothetical protein